MVCIAMCARISSRVSPGRVVDCDRLFLRCRTSVSRAEVKTFGHETATGEPWNVLSML
jgi:hypothetical protein